MALWQKENGICEMCNGRGELSRKGVISEPCFRCAGTGYVKGREPTEAELKRAGRWLARRKAERGA